MTKVYDCFTFFNEVELLKFRVEYLKNVVDSFIIIEASETHSGKPKNQNFSYDFFDEEVRKKIKYFYIDFPKEGLENELDFKAEYMLQTKEGLLAWARENYQRNFIYKALESFELKDEDIILISDLDEIISERAILFLKEDASVFNTHKLISLSQIPFFYTIYSPWRVNLEEPQKYLWNHPKATIKKFLVKPNVLRMSPPDAQLLGGGWHFGYFGGGDRMRIKHGSIAKHSTDTVEPQEALEASLSVREQVIKATEKIPVDILMKQFDIPALIFSDKFIDFFEGGVK